MIGEAKGHCTNEEGVSRWRSDRSWKVIGAVDSFVRRYWRVVSGCIALCKDVAWWSVVLEFDMRRGFDVVGMVDGLLVT